MWTLSGNLHSLAYTNACPNGTEVEISRRDFESFTEHKSLAQYIDDVKAKHLVEASDCNVSPFDWISQFLGFRSKTSLPCQLQVCQSRKRIPTKNRRSSRQSRRLKSGPRNRSRMMMGRPFKSRKMFRTFHCLLVTTIPTCLSTSSRIHSPWGKLKHSKTNNTHFKFDFSQRWMPTRGRGFWSSGGVVRVSNGQWGQVQVQGTMCCATDYFGWRQVTGCKRGYSFVLNFWTCRFLEQTVN